MSRIFWVPLELGDLENVDTDTIPPSDGQALLWDAATGTYKPGDVATGGSGELVVATSGDELVFSTDGQSVVTATS